MFEREHRRRVATALEALDAELLVAHACPFGGETAIALRHGEYRESVDIGLPVSDPAGYRGYRALRQRATGRNGINSITRAAAALDQLREMRANQYGARTLVRVAGVKIKFEFVLEGRSALAAPGAKDGGEQAAGHCRPPVR